MDKQIIGLQQAAKVLVSDWIALQREGDIEAKRFTLEQLIDLIFSIIDLDNSLQGSSFRGTAIPSTNPGAQTQPGFWLAITPGTYANMGGVVVPASSIAVISYSAQSSTYSIVTAALPQPLNKIAAWSNVTAYNIGDQSNRSGQIWEANAVTVAGEEPGISAKWTPIITGFIAKSLSNSIGVTPNSTHSTATTTESTRILYNPVGVAGVLTKLEVWGSRGVPVEFRVFTRGTGNLFTMKTKFTLPIGIGLNTFNIEDLPVVDLLATDYFGWHGVSSGGFVGYRVATSNNYTFAGDAITETDFTLNSTVEFGIKVTVGTNNGELDNAKKDTTNNTAYFFNKDLDVTTFTSVSAVTSTRIFKNRIKIEGYVGNVTCNITRAGDLKFLIWQENADGTLSLKRSKTVSAVLGVNNFLLNLKAEKGTYLSWYHAAGTAFIGYKTATNIIWGQVTADSGDNIARGAYTTTVDFGISYNVIPYAFSSLMISSVTPDPSVSSARPALQTVGTVIKNSFYSGSGLPADWVNPGGFIATSNGLQSPASGGWSAVAYWNKLIVLDEDTTTAKFKIQDLTSIFSLVRTSAQGLGTAFEIDCAAGNINLYSVLTGIGVTPSSVASTKPIGFALVLNREYHVTIKKVSENYYFTFTDSVTLASSVISWFSTGNGTSIGKCWNYPGVVFRQGNILMLELCLSSALPRSPRVFILGDSITDGDTIRTSVGGGYMNRWAGLLSTALNYNTSIMARGGETTTEADAKIPLINQMFKSPAFAIYALGTNDTSFSTWQTNMLAFKAAIEAKGAELILTTLYPRSGREAFCLQVTNYILTSGIRYIDFAKAITVNGDRITRDDTLLLPDQLHPLPSGHLKMFNQLKVNVGDIFNI